MSESGNDVQIGQPQDPALAPGEPTPMALPIVVVPMAPEPSSFEAEAFAGALEALRATKPWVRFLGVLGIIGASLMALVALMLFVLPRVGAFQGLPTPLRVVLPFVYLVMGAFYIPPVVFLNQYASRIGTLLTSHAPGDLARALEAQKKFWKVVGIYTLGLLCLYVLLALLAVGVGVVTAAAHRF